MGCDASATISQLLGLMEIEYRQPQLAPDGGLRLACSLSAPASEKELSALTLKVHSDLLEFWTISREAELFGDVDYGQWGLKILSPQESSQITGQMVQERPGDFRSGDLVVGQFQGDSDFLLIRCNVSAHDFGRVLVGLPLDGRDHWYEVACCFNRFLEKYVEAKGMKYWEPRPGH